MIQHPILPRSTVDWTVVHLARGVDSRVTASGSGGGTVIVEAPEDLAEVLRRSGAVTLDKATSRGFRRRYYGTLLALLRPDHHPWGMALDPDLRVLVKAMGLGVAKDTWKGAELLLSLSRLEHGSPLRLRIVTDNDEGIRLWQLLRRTMPAAAVRVDDRRSAKHRRNTRVPRWLERYWLNSGDALRSAQDAWGSIRLRQVQLDSRRPRVVLFGDGTRAWRFQLPVWEALMREDVEVAALTTRFPIARWLVQRGIRPWLASPSRVPPGIRRRLHRALAVLPLGEGLLGSQAAWIKQALPTMLEMEMQRYLRRCVAAMRATRRLANNRLGAVFFHTMGPQPTGTAVLVEARRRGARAVLSPHGLLDYGSPELGFYPDLDAFIVWGETMQEGLLRSALPRAIPVVPLGNAHLESALRSWPERRDIPRDSPHRSPMVLVVFGRPSRVIRRSAFDAAAEEVLDAAANLSNYHFLIKLHPADTSGVWQMMVGRRNLPNVNVVVQADGDFYELLQGSAVVVTMHSTAGAEALTAGVPVVSVDIRSADDDALRDPDYVAAEAAYTVRERGGLTKVLEELAGCAHGCDPLALKRQQFGSRFLKSGPGSAAERVAALLSRLARAEDPRVVGTAALLDTKPDSDDMSDAYQPSKQLD